MIKQNFTVTDPDALKSKQDVLVSNQVFKYNCPDMSLNTPLAGQQKCGTCT